MCKCVNVQIGECANWEMCKCTGRGGCADNLKIYKPFAHLPILTFAHSLHVPALNVLYAGLLDVKFILLDYLANLLLDLLSLYVLEISY